MEQCLALGCLSALAHAHRLTLFRLLVKAGDEGMAVGEMAAVTGMAGATLTNHLHILRRAGLVADERRGRGIQCRACYPQMNALLDFLTENCCADLPGVACASGCKSKSTRSSTR